MNQLEQTAFQAGDALVIVDLQNDFLPGGALAVARGDEVIPVLNDYIADFQKHDLPIFITRDWHPPDHCSFKAQGGPWPTHCVAGSSGAQFAKRLKLPKSAIVISKPSNPSQETYDGFEGTALEKLLRENAVRRLFIGGLATDYCVRHTVIAGLARGFTVFLLTDAIQAVNVHPNDGAEAQKEMFQLGARPFELHQTA